MTGRAAPPGRSSAGPRAAPPEAGGPGRVGRAAGRLDPASAPGRFGVAGAPGTRLLAGPPLAAGPERLASHLARLGPLELSSRTPESLRAEVAASGLTGRGGGQFPVARKLETVARSPGRALVAVNSSEGEPASRKDRTLLELRPHLLIDGALVAARATGAGEVVVYLHRHRRAATAALEAALAEREGLPVAVRVVDAPNRYVAGESTAVVGYLEGSGALPARRPRPVASAGVGGRPTLVSNAETVAHLALLARFGPAWFRGAGSVDQPGSTLVTLAGQVALPGLVAEVLDPLPLGRLLATVGGLDGPPQAVLVGGYEGTWVSGEVAWATPLDRGLLAAAGAPLGCGLLAVLGAGACGLATTARLLRWLAGESAGQCGPCVHGLPALARAFADLAGPWSTRRDERRVRGLIAEVHGRGACGHPTGAAILAESALEAFAGELRRHRRLGCPPVAEGFPLPVARGSGR